jgi:DNA polymerase III subunit epsilon
MWEKRSRFVVIDVETTGFSPKNGDRVIEIGAVAIEKREIIAEFSSLIDAGVSIPLQAQQVHGITNEMLKGQPVSDEVLPKFHDFIAGSTLVAHNAAFDIGFLRAEFAFLGMEFNNPCLCTLKMSRNRYPQPPNYKLKTVGRYLFGESIDWMNSHRALDDARLAAMIFLEMEKA